MSSMSVVDYTATAIKCKASCSVIAEKIEQIDGVLERIEKNASSIINEEIKEVEKAIILEREEIKGKLEETKDFLNRYLKEGSGYDYSFNNEAETLTRNLEEAAMNLTTDRIIALEKTIIDTLKESLKNETSIKITNQKNYNEITKIKDVNIRSLAYKRFLKNQDESIEQLLLAAKEEYKQLLNETKEESLAELKRQLKKENIDPNIIENVKTVKEAEALVNKAKIEERTRKEVLSIIIKAIKKQGFIVDTKKNLKIDHETNKVKLKAEKTTGEKALFEIDLNGQFMYHFKGYEGQACKNNIEPFLKDLDEIYGVEITKSTSIWENPDKITTKKMQYKTTKTNVNRG